MGFFNKIGQVFSGGLDDIIPPDDEKSFDELEQEDNDYVKIGVGPTDYTGSVSNLGKVFRICMTAGAIIGGSVVGYRGIKGLFNYMKDRKKAQEEIERINARKEADIAKINAQAEANIRVVEAKAKAKAEAKAQQQARQCSQQSYGDSSDPDDNDWWLDEFNRNHPLPIDALPDDFATVISGSDPDIAPAMFFHLCSMYGAYCFSRVIAKKRDDEIRRPNLQVVIEAMPGMGKSLFRNVHQMLFRRVIDEDKRKLNSPKAKDNEKKLIIQTVGIDISSARLQQILESNQGVHVYIFDSEIATATNKDLSVILRKAFDNDDVSRGRMHKEQNGSCEAVANITLTGADENVETFIKNIATVAGGGASRVCWCVLPLMSDSNDAPISLHEGPELELIRDHIDEYRHKYVFTTDDGEDTAVDLVEIKDFDYVMSELNRWEMKQVELSRETNDEVRKLIRWRISTIAMHIGIVMHMMIQPDGDTEKMDQVIQMVIYAAEYCMSRYLLKFGAEHSKMVQNFKRKERVPRQRLHRQGGQAPYNSPAAKDEELEQRRVDVIRLKMEGLNQHQIAQELNLHDAQVARILEKEGLK